MNNLSSTEAVEGHLTYLLKLTTLNVDVRSTLIVYNVVVKYLNSRLILNIV